jgi:tagaturonate reductase
MSALPETILQFGAGKFLRAFADLFIHQANAAGQAIGRVVLVQSTGDDRAGRLTQQGGQYHVVIRGYADGQTIDTIEPCASISRALHAGSQWADVLRVARTPELRFVLSNTTEAGYALDPADEASAAPPRSFPAKLLAVLHARWSAGQPGLTLIPCELREGNADQLFALVQQLAAQWQLPTAFQTWIGHECVWLNTLVDRIVTGTPSDHPLLASDALLTVCEPYALFAIQDKPGAYPFVQNPAIVRAADITPYFLRKVRILNAAHTALLIHVRPLGIPIVRTAVQTPSVRRWLERLLFEEIVPTLQGRVDQPAAFAKQTIDRFLNPFLDHKFSDIALHHAEKVRVRLEPTQAEFRALFGRTPPLLDEVLAAERVYQKQ